MARRLSPDDKLTILHVSDAHFGAPDDRKELPRITDALIRAAHQQPWTPDVCVFSGDLAHAATQEDFERGIQWLCRLLERWPEAKLFVVPGNHDVERDKANLILRQAYVDERTYSNLRDRLQKSIGHLSQFFAAHSKLKSIFGAKIVSEWSSPFGCKSSFTHQARSIRLIGINTSLLSCANDDEAKLVVDLGSLNNLLSEHVTDSECVITIGHHPLNWLVPWNHQEVDRLLKQATGSHLYLHGHQHDQSSAAQSTSKGESLATLECGAAYQGSRWPQYFSVYRLVFKHRNIETAVFALSPSSGLWVKNNERSSSIPASLPSDDRADHVQVDSDAEEVPWSHVESPTPATKREETPLEPKDASFSSKDGLELEARRLLEIAELVFDTVNSILTDEFLKALPLYRVEKRIKELDRICEKVNQKKKRDNTYTVRKVEDVCGFRYVSLYQSDIPRIIESILDALIKYSGNIKFEKDISISVHTSRPINDPLAINPLIDRLVKEWPGRCAVEYINRPTGYSSVHVVISSTFRRTGKPSIYMPIEIQFRSGLEEFWGQLDHKLRYYTGRGAVGDTAWQRHLNVLKAQFDAAIQYVDLIKEAAEPANLQIVSTNQGVTTESTLSISTPEAQLASLRDLPKNIYDQVAKAYALWVQADASRQFGGNPSKFREAADAFIPLLDGCHNSISNEELSRRLAHTANMERAYMLCGTNDKDNLEAAEGTYRTILHSDKNDATALFRLGQLLIKRQCLNEAVEYLDLAINATKNTAVNKPDSEAARIYDFARANKAIVNFRNFEDRSLENNVRAEALRAAISTARTVLETGRDERARRTALNDMVYYAWEEIKFRGAEAGALTLTVAEFERYARELLRQFENGDDLSFREYDTQCRVAWTLSLLDKAIESATAVLLLLEKAARARGGGDSIEEEARFNAIWSANVMSSLVDDDEKDSLRFALTVVASTSKHTEIGNISHVQSISAELPEQ